MGAKQYISRNVTGTTEVVLVQRDRNQDIDITGLTICNTHSEDTTYVDLYLKRINEEFHEPGKDGNWNTTLEASTDDNPNKYSSNADATCLYIMKDLEITANNTLILEPREIDYNAQEFSLMLQLNAADSSVDVILNFNYIRRTNRINKRI